MPPSIREASYNVKMQNDIVIATNNIINAIINVAIRIIITIHVTDWMNI